jgi:hypothetical protein
MRQNQSQGPSRLQPQPRKPYLRKGKTRATAKPADEVATRFGVELSASGLQLPQPVPSVSFSTSEWDLQLNTAHICASLVAHTLVPRTELPAE